MPWGSACKHARRRTDQGGRLHWGDYLRRPAVRGGKCILSPSGLTCGAFCAPFACCRGRALWGRNTCKCDHYEPQSQPESQPAEAVPDLVHGSRLMAQCVEEKTLRGADFTAGPNTLSVRADWRCIDVEHWTDISHTHAWHNVGHIFHTLSPAVRADPGCTNGVPFPQDSIHSQFVQTYIKGKFRATLEESMTGQTRCQNPTI